MKGLKVFASAIFLMLFMPAAMFILSGRLIKRHKRKRR
jgi:hypothetical protein